VEVRLRVNGSAQRLRLDSRMTIEYFEYLNRFAPFEAMLRANEQWLSHTRGS
jgi:hypothetical protein